MMLNSKSARIVKKDGDRYQLNCGTEGCKAFFDISIKLLNDIDKTVSAHCSWCNSKFVVQPYVGFRIAKIGKVGNNE